MPSDPDSGISETEEARQLADGISQIVWASRPDGSPFYFNERWWSYSGLDRRAFARAPIADQIHDEDREKTLQAWRTGMSEGKAAEARFRLRSADGSYRWHLGKILPIRDSQGRILKWYGIAEDISGPKEAEAELRRSQESLVFALQSARMGTWEFDIATQFLSCSKEMLDLWGVSEEEFVGHRSVLQSKVHPDDLEKMRSAIDHAIKACGIYDLEFRIIPSPGKIRWVQSRGRCTLDAGSEKPSRFSGVVFDITEKKNAEEAIKHSLEEHSLYAAKVMELHFITSELSKALTEAEVHGVIESHVFKAFNANGGVLFEPNEEGSELRWMASSGYEESFRSRFERIPCQGDLPVQRAFSTGEPVFVESIRDLSKLFPEAALANESVGTQALATIPVSVGNQMRGVFHFGYRSERTFSDNTRRFMLTLAAHCGEALERAKLYDLSQRAVTARDTMISLSAHELLTPVTASKLQTQLFKRKVAIGLEISRDALLNFASVTDSSLTRLTQLVNDMLDVSRVNAGKFTVRPERTNLSELLSGVIERSSIMATDAGCEIQASIRPDIYSYVDAYRIEQVVTNLISNAYRYAPGKPIDVELGVTADGHARITVTDRGMGIRKEDQVRIFERFERATDMNEKSGLGLGLFIVKQIVEAHQGNVRVESEPGQGAKFTVELPMER